ncbi:MAG: hypothetical protein HY512_01385 [Candidatus Aenigmarchaeota archaeon]|nr:hypothetical protein [Candidatus Aenigmarchaeota archaeon]
MVFIFCPKCGGGTYIAEEELIKILEGRTLRAILKILYVCRACSEKFSRLVHEDLEARKRDERGTSVQQGYNQGSSPSSSTEQIPETLKFF